MLPTLGPKFELWNQHTGGRRTNIRFMVIILPYMTQDHLQGNGTTCIRIFIPKWDTHITSFHPRLRDYCGRWSRHCKSQWQQMSSRKQQDSRADEFRAIVTECTTPEKTQARPNLSMVGEATYAIVEELLETCSCWKRESICFNNVVPSKSTMLCLMESNTLKNTWPTQTGFKWLKKKGDKVE